MRIAIDARSLEGDKTGVGRYLENILRCWQARKDVQFVLYFKDKVPEREYFAGNSFVLKRLENPLGFSSNFFFQHVLLPYNLKKDGADFFFSPFYLRPFLCPVRSAIVLHDISYEAHPEWFDRKSQFILKTFSKVSAKKADAIFTVSEYSKSEITKYYGTAAEKITVTPLACDSSSRKTIDRGKVETIKSKYGLTKFILSVGTIFTRRHAPEIIEAFGKFARSREDIQFCIIGRNRTYPFVDIDSRIHEINDRLGGERIMRVDFAEERELEALYSACEAVIYLSDYEGFGLPVVEAQSFEKPVITSRNTSLVEVGGGSVEFVEKNMEEDILGSFERVLCDSAYYNELISKGKENIKRFSWQRCADQTLETILKNV